MPTLEERVSALESRANAADNRDKKIRRRLKNHLHSIIHLLSRASVRKTAVYVPKFHGKFKNARDAQATFEGVMWSELDEEGEKE